MFRQLRPNYFENRESEYVRTNKSNGSEDRELGQGNDNISGQL